MAGAWPTPAVAARLQATGVDWTRPRADLSADTRIRDLVDGIGLATDDLRDPHTAHWPARVAPLRQARVARYSPCRSSII